MFVVCRNLPMRVSLKKIANVQMGYTFRSGLSHDPDASVAVIQMKDLLDSNVLDASGLFNVEFDRVIGDQMVHGGDLLFRSRGNLSQAAIVEEEPGVAIAAAPLLRIRVFDPSVVLPQYLCWWIEQREAQAFFSSRAKGSAQRMISKNTVEELVVPVPPLEQQMVIVDIASLAQREGVLTNMLLQKRKQLISFQLNQIIKGE